MAAVLQEHPVVKVQQPPAAAGLDVHAVAPVKGIACRLAAGHAFDIAGGALITVIAGAANAPYPLLLLAVVALPFILIKMQPDLGTALILIPVVGFTAFAARLKWRYLIILGAIALIILPAAYFSLKDYQRDRIMVFLDPERDPQNRGWNQLQAEMAIGSGGFTGKGFMQSTQNPMGYLPQTVSNSDFIFPVIAEETGFIGSLFVVLMFMLLLFSVLRTALLAADDFGRYLCVGVATVIFFHSVINIGMSIRLTPVTGLPLPLISYGGTFLVAMLVYLGIVHSIYVHREKRSIMDL